MVPEFLNSYFLTSFSLVPSLSISCLVLGPSYVPSARTADKQKVSAYECGSNPLEDARNQSDVRFYLVAIPFITLDPEVSFLSPWAVTLNQIVCHTMTGL